MLHVALIILSGVLKAVSDTLADHFDTSIFKKLNPKFWDKNISWEYVGFLPLTKYHPDAWHLSNSGLIFSFVLSANCTPILSVQILSNSFWNVVANDLLNIAVDGVLFIAAFNLCYSHLFVKRKSAE